MHFRKLVKFRISYVFIMQPLVEHLKINIWTKINVYRYNYVYNFKKLQEIYVFYIFIVSEA